MKRIYIIIAGAFLILLIVTSMFLSLKKKSVTNTSSTSPFPTSLPRQDSNKQVDQNLSNLSNLSNSSNSPLDISIIEPIETEDFKLQYSPKLNKVVIEKKTPQAEEQFLNWANQNQTQLIEDPDLILIVDSGQNPDDFNPLIDFLNIFMNFGQGSQQSNNGTIEQSPSPSSLSPNGLTPNPSMTYYAQGGDLGNTPLPDGCTLGYAGCGPTTVAMIASSYLNKSYDPKAIVNLYKSKGYYLGCGGSSYLDAHELLGNLGLKTTDYLFFNLEKADTVVPQLRKSIDAGWTFFALARFCDDPKKGYCGHIFWITDIDDKGSIFAYDPGYGRYEIPYNENSRYPYPLYRLAFGVKR
ncbi:MAG: hypothetical protein AAB441_04520 [Patescibacteria group bacterium]